MSTTSETTTSSRGGGNPGNPATDPNSEKIPPAETETTKISSVSQTTAATNKSETDPNSEKIPPAEKETTESSPVSQTTAAADKPETDPNSEKTPPSKISPVSQTTAETNKPETDPNSKKIPPAENETTKSSPVSQTTAATNKPETDPNSKKTPPAEISPVSQTTTETNKLETDPNSEKIPPAENETTKSSPVSQTAAATNKPETDPNNEKTPPAEISPVSQTTGETNKPETDPNSEKIPPAENETTKSSPVSQTTAATNKPETDPNSKKTPPAEISPAHQATAGTNKPETDPNSEKIPPAGISPVSQTTDTGAPKSSSWNKYCKKLINILRFQKHKKSQSKSSAASQGTEVEKSQKDQELVKKDLDYINMCIKELGDKQLQLSYEKALHWYNYLTAHGKRKGEDFHELRNDVMKLKLEVPIKHKLGADKNQSHKELQFGSKARQRNDKEVLQMVPQLHNSDLFERTMDFKDFVARFVELKDQLKLCLLCFSVFPENAIIKRRLMVQWWVVEGFASEGDANDCFIQLMEKGFIEPENKNRNLSVRSCRMHPFDRSALLMLAERAKFFNFGERGEPTQNFSGSFQGCLVGEGLISFGDLTDNNDGKKLRIDDLEKLHLLFNVHEQILDFKFDWFSKMKNVNFLYLGRWKVLATDHIEVEDTEFLKGLENMRYLKFLSLQGVSNIIALPESILKLISLKILDLRACYNLETVPERIGFLKNLTHLDMSECYLLAHMPKSLQSLEKLEVLKGFVVGRKPEEKSKEQEKKKSCTLHDLERLKGLIKLCIYTDSSEFPEAEDVKALGKLEKLRKLTITWGGGTLRGDPATGKQSENGNKKGKPTAEKTKAPDKQDPAASESTDSFPWTLEKLDLKCFPKRTAPDWLKLHKLKGPNELKKLYIRGGRFSDLGQYQDIDLVEKKTWKVEVLRLKYLSEIEMEWDQLQELFPELVYLEQVSCPKLTLFPCDSNGVWINKNKNNPKASSANHH